MTEQQLKDIIVDQVAEILKLKKELDLSNYMRSFTHEQYLEQKNKATKLEVELANIPMATLEAIDDDIGVGLTD